MILGNFRNETFDFGKGPFNDWGGFLEELKIATNYLSYTATKPCDPQMLLHLNNSNYNHY